jgi:hypothetical protein
MKLRKLRIAWSVGWGIAAVLLCVLWLRSHNWVEQVFLPISQSTYFSAGSMPNAFRFGVVDKSPTNTWAWLRVTTHGWLSLRDPKAPPWSGARFFGFSEGRVAIPYWFGVLSLVAIATLPWVKENARRFSLRTLLIGTTLVAVVLGVIVWAVR